MRKVMATCLAAILILVVTMARGQKDEFEDEGKLQQEQWKALNKEGEDLFLESEQEWEKMLREQQEAWKQMVAEVNRIWLDSLATTKKSGWTTVTSTQPVPMSTLKREILYWQR